MKRKITVTTGSRAEYGILRPVLQNILESKKLQLYLIVVGMHLSKKHGFTINEIKKDGFKIFKTIQMTPKQDSSNKIAESLGKGIIAFSKTFQKLKPDINLVLGDRYEMLASTIAAYHMNIPNAHIHGGDRSQGGIDEYTRHAITKMSNIHFAATPKSYDRILKMGENRKYVFLTGSPSVDEVIKGKISSKSELKRNYGIDLNGDEILFIQHPVTTQTKSVEKQIMASLDALEKAKKTTIVIAPNSDVGHRTIFKHLQIFSTKNNFVKVYPTLPRKDYLGILKNCGVLVGNSSSGMIEASYFDTPVVNIGIRQSGRERGNNVLDVPEHNSKSIYQAIVLSLKRKKDKKFSSQYVYGKGNAAKKIVHYLEKVNLDKELIQKQIQY